MSAIHNRPAYDLDPGAEKMHSSCTVVTVAERERSAPFLNESPTTKRMTWTPSATREDVLKVVRKYVLLEFSIRSAAGKLAIDESRVAKNASIAVEADCSETEFRQGLQTYLLRRAIYASPEAPTHYPTYDPRHLSSDTSGRPLRRVAPLRDVAAIVRPKSSRGSGTPQTSKRDWRASVAQKLAKMGRLLMSEGIDRADVLVIVEIEKDRQRRVIVRNQLQAERSAAGRLKSGGKATKHQRHEADGRVAELRAIDASLTERIQAGVRTRAYRHGIDHLLALCTATPDIERDIFGEIE